MDKASIRPPTCQVTKSKTEVSGGPKTASPSPGASLRVFRPALFAARRLAARRLARSRAYRHVGQLGARLAPFEVQHAVMVGDVDGVTVDQHVERAIRGDGDLDAAAAEA